MPTVTVVIPTAGRVALTRASIESIKRASSADGVEADIVIVDSSSEMERSQLQEICTQLGAEFLDGPLSVSEKRNLGAEHARTEHVMFMDSDCAVVPGCFIAHLAAMLDPGVHASQGTVLFRGPERLAFRAVRCSGLLNAFKPPDGLPVLSAASGNLMVRRASFLQVRFDPRLGPPGLGGEDVDFGFRSSARGFRIVGTPTAIVFHETVTWNSLWMNARRFFSWGRSEAHLIERHPAMSYVDMPSPVLVALLMAIVCIVAVPWSWATLLALPLGFLSYAAVMSLAGIRHHPQDRLGGAVAHWVFFVLDLGRVWESIRRVRPRIALMRLRFADDQVTQEWRDLVPTSWAVWLMVLTGIVFLWAAVH